MNAPPAGLDCQQVVELVTEYLEDALDPDRRARVREHLTGCDGCEQYVRQLRGTAAALGSLPVPALSGPMPDRLLAAFRGWSGPAGC